MATPSRERQLVGNVWQYRTVETNGGSGSQTLQTATAVIHHADIITLPASPVEVVAAPASGAAIIPLYALLVATIVAGPGSDGYTGFDPFCGLFVSHDGAITPSLLAPLGEGDATQVENLLGGSAGTYFAIMPPSSHVVGAPSDTTGYISTVDPATSHIDGKPLAVFLDNAGAGNLQDGQAGNTLTVTILYTVITF